MAYIDPWSGFNEGTKTLASMAATEEAKRTAEATRLENQRRWNIENARLESDWEFKKAERERKLADEEAVRSELVKASKPYEVTSQVDNPDYANYQNSLAAYTTAQYPPEPSPTAGIDADVAGLSSAVQENPAFAKLSGSDKRLGAMVADQRTQQEFQNTFVPQDPQASPEENAQSLAGVAPLATLPKTTSVAPSTWRMQYEAGKALTAKGIPQGQAMQEAAAKGALDEATKILTLTGDAKEAVKVFNEATGAKLSYLGKKGDWELIKGENGMVTAINMDVLRKTGDLGEAAQQIGEPKPATPGKVYGNPRSVKFGSELVKEHPIFEGANAEENKKAWEKAGSNFDKLGDFNGYAKKDNDNTPRISISGGGIMERPVPVIDTENGNAVTFATRSEINANKGRYLPSTGGATEKAMNKENLMRDIQDASKSTRTSLQNLKSDFNAKQRAQFSYVLKSKDSHSALSTFLGSSVGKTLSPDQVDYITDIVQLKENAMAMRGVLGAGQGSDEMREAISATIPGAATANKAYALKQLDKFDNQLARLNRGVPKIPLKGDLNGSQQIGKYKVTVR